MLIYKITNNLNQKSYIGQTIKSGEDRWEEHQRHCVGTHPNDQNKVLYKAMRKYGIENFSFEVLQDDITDYTQLDKAEIYWIDYYNSFLKGYNSTFGGQTYHKILPNKEVIEDYYRTRSARKTAINFGIDHSTVDNILNQNNIPRFSFRQAAGQKVCIKKDDFYQEFDSMRDCAEWFVDNKVCKTSQPESARTGLKTAKAKNKTYYGYFIENI